MLDSWDSFCCCPSCHSTATAAACHLCLCGAGPTACCYPPALYLHYKTADSKQHYKRAAWLWHGRQTGGGWGGRTGRTDGHWAERQGRNTCTALTIPSLPPSHSPAYLSFLVL